MGERVMARIKTVALVAGISLAAAIAGSFAMASETVTYTYDAKGRLVKVAHTGTVNNNVVANYSFDGADNRKTMNVTGAP
jgi:YD repeat-containing protein